jgi:hypothetical protein
MGLIVLLSLAACATTNTLSADELNRAITFCMAGGQVAVILGTDWECTGVAFWPASASP